MRSCHRDESAAQLWAQARQVAFHTPATGLVFRAELAEEFAAKLIDRFMNLPLGSFPPMGLDILRQHRQHRLHLKGLFQSGRRMV
jgi:hypothetical protein